MNLKKLIKARKFPEPIFVSQPCLPNLKDYNKYLEKIWKSKWLTNNGAFNNRFEVKLNKYLGSRYCSLTCNGTVGMLIAFRVLNITEGEVITTPFTFAATPHVLTWNNLTPVFCDIEKDTFNIDPELIEKLITPKTKAILPVHVFGNPCNVEKIEKIAKKYSLKVIYDAAHAFGVKYKNKPIVQWGDISVLSFHATKHFNTLEGGALITKSRAFKKTADLLKNFGIADEETVSCPGINGKMNELQAAYGILELDMVKDEVTKRKKISDIYKKNLKNFPGITLLKEKPGVKYNYTSFPILINKRDFGMCRSELYSTLKKFNIHPRKYFYPLCSDYPCYSHLHSSKKDKLPASHSIAENILCLPLYGSLKKNIVIAICNLIGELRNYRQ